MSDLFLARSAMFGGPSRTYRYELRRVWNEELPLLVVCMLNPSTADDERDDPTIRELIHFARLWGHGGLMIVNLFAFRSSSPAEMLAYAEPVGIDNGEHIQAAIEYATAHGGRILAAWGNADDFKERADWFAGRAVSQGIELVCLGRTLSNCPKHPMARGKHRIARDQQPIVWRTPWPST